jgi:hypothetical protein
MRGGSELEVLKSVVEYGTDTKDLVKSLETIGVAVQYGRYRACKPPIAG